MAEEGIQVSARQEDPQNNMAEVNAGTTPMEAEAEQVKEAPASDQPHTEPESGMCSESPRPSIPVSENVSASMKLLSSCHPSQIDDQPVNKVPVINSPEVNSISDAMPSLDLNCKDAWPPLVSPAPKTPCPYNLRSLGGNPVSSGVMGGLSTSSSQALVKNKRGRHSHLSKAQLKAKLDVADGKQYSIPGVLRAAQPSESVLR